MSRLRVAFLIFSVWASVLFARADVLYVDASAPGPVHDGTSWAAAYADLQTALAAAIAGDEIWVAEGLYKPAASDRIASFALKNGVGIYGGFHGTETLRTERDPAANVTTLSGDIGAAGLATDNSHHVVTSGAGVTATAVLDGFTITGGQADGSTPNNKGGGVYVVNGAPTLVNLRLLGNYAAERGGGVRVDAGSPSLSACLFQGNSAGGGTGFGGGGLSAGVVGTLTVDRCVFRGNSVSFATSAGAIQTSNNTIVTNSLVVQNSPNGISFAQQGNKLVNCTITGNSGYGVTFVDVNNTVANSILRGNASGEINPFFNDAAVSYTDIAGGHAGAGNIDLDPLFENAAGGDYRLRAGSPAVDAGSNTAAAGFLSDLSGLPRFFDDPAAPTRVPAPRPSSTWGPTSAFP